MNDNTSYTTYLRKVAQELVEQAEKPFGLRAILLPGSVAKGIADAYSDIELKCIWTNEPSKEDRATIFQALPTQPLFAENLEDGEWCSSFTYKSVKVDVSHLGIDMLTSTICKTLSAESTSIVNQTLLASIQDSDALYGADTLDGIKSQIAIYPPELAAACIKVNASFTSWSMRNALLARQDMIALNHLIDGTLLQMMRLLYALNQVYLSSYNFKWLRYESEKLTIKPQNMEARIEKLLSGPHGQAITELDKLLHEVFELVVAHRPDIDVLQQKEALSYTRAPMKVSTDGR